MPGLEFEQFEIILSSKMQLKLKIYLCQYLVKQRTIELSIIIYQRTPHKLNLLSVMDGGIPNILKNISVSVIEDSAMKDCNQTVIVARRKDSYFAECVM